MRMFVALVGAAAGIGLAAPAMLQAAARPYADFRVTVSGVQTTTATGMVDCTPIDDGSAAATASSTARFSTRSRLLQFERTSGVVSVVPVSGDMATLEAHATLQRASTFAGNPPLACPSGKPPGGCGTTTVHFPLLVQGGFNATNVIITDPPHVPECLVPAAFPFPVMLQPDDEQTGSHVTYSAPVPKSLFEPARHVIVIQGRARETSKADDGNVSATETTTLRFTMRLSRVREP
jgi:hypothetical protein